MVLAAATALWSGCSSGPSAVQDNSGVVINTGPDDPITQSMLVGKWDLDGELTNTANGAAGVGAIPSDIVKDVLGKGWRFAPGGELRTDALVGSKPGEWKVEGKNTLMIREYGQGEFTSYQASFKDGYLYLKSPDQTWRVFERDKFFGF